MTELLMGNCLVLGFVPQITPSDCHKRTGIGVFHIMRW